MSSLRLLLFFVQIALALFVAHAEEFRTNSTGLSTLEGPPKNNSSSSTTTRRTCQCNSGSCSCCSGNLLGYFNVTARYKTCVNIAYEPDEFEFHYKILFNERLMYQNKFSGKNPPPVCLPLRRFLPGTLCIRFNNVYMIGRNFHGCVNFEGLWQQTELFSVSFECFRIGTGGIALVKPEDGGGLPISVGEEVVNEEDLDYNDSA